MFDEGEVGEWGDLVPSLWGVFFAEPLPLLLAAGGLRIGAQEKDKRGTIEDELPHEFGQIFISRAVRAPLILALIHGTLHARLEESLRRCVGPRGNKFIEFIHAAL